MRITLDLLKSSISKKGYTWFNDRPNIIGIRSSLDVPNAFNDFLCLSWIQPQMPNGLDARSQQSWLNKNLFFDQNGQKLSEDGNIGTGTKFAINSYLNSVGKERLKIWTITTDPGTYWLNNPINRLGTAVLKPNQWIDCWQIGNHKSDPKHPALVQVKPLTVWRDSNRDNLITTGTREETGLFGINIHRSNLTGRTMSIGKWSAGCQVFQTKTHLDQLLSICNLYRKSVGNRFTYTLLEEKDIK